MKIRKKKLAMRRRAYALLLILVIIIIAVVFYNAGKSSGEESVSGNNLIAAGAGSYTADGTTSGSESTLYSSRESNYYPVESISSNGFAATNPMIYGASGTNLSYFADDQKLLIRTAKEAMEKSGVNNTLLLYAPDGKWHSIETTSDDICVFYSGHHEDIPVRFVYTLLSDGTYQLTEIRYDGVSVEDMEDFLNNM